jgi:hypothetical protein
LFLQIYLPHRGLSFFGFATYKDDPDCCFCLLLLSHIYLNLFMVSWIVIL